MTYTPFGVGVLSLPIDVGIVLMISSPRRIVTVLVSSSAVAISRSPMVNVAFRSSCPNSPLPRSAPKAFTWTSTVVPDAQKSLGRQRTSRSLTQ